MPLESMRRSQRDLILPSLLNATLDNYSRHNCEQRQARFQLLPVSPDTSSDSSCFLLDP